MQALKKTHNIRHFDKVDRNIYSKKNGAGNNELRFKSPIVA